MAERKATYELIDEVYCTAKGHFRNVFGEDPPEACPHTTRHLLTMVDHMGEARIAETILRLADTPGKPNAD